MDLGSAVGFRSWPTILVHFEYEGTMLLIFIEVHIFMCQHFQQFLSYRGFVILFRENQPNGCGDITIFTFRDGGRPPSWIC